MRLCESHRRASARRGGRGATAAAAAEADEAAAGTAPRADWGSWGTGTVGKCTENIGMKHRLAIDSYYT